MKAAKSSLIGLAIVLSTSCAVSPTGPGSATTARAVAATLSSAELSEVGGVVWLQIRTSGSGAWQVTLPDWISTTAPLFGVGNADLSLSVGRSDSDRSADLLVNQARLQIVQKVAVQISATCYSGRPGDVVLFACSAFLSRHRAGVMLNGRIWADFSGMGYSSNRTGSYVAGNADWDVHIPTTQAVGKVTIPIHVQYGDGFTATALPEFTVLPR